MDHKKNQQGQEDARYPNLAPVSRGNDAADAGISRRGFLGLAAASILLAHIDQQSPRSESSSMRASIFSTTAGTTTAARVKSAWAMRCGTATAKKPF